MSSGGYGETCPKCGDTIGVENTRVEGNVRIRLMACRNCGYRPEDNKQVVPIELAPKRITRRINFRR